MCGGGLVFLAGGVIVGGAGGGGGGKGGGGGHPHQHSPSIVTCCKHSWSSGIRRDRVDGRPVMDRGVGITGRDVDEQLVW